MLDLDVKYIKFIKDIIHRILPEAHIFIYGSRVQGVAREYSDVDIALKCAEKVKFTDLLKIKSIFQNSTFPYKVDLVDLNDLKPEFLKIIEKDLFELK